MRRSWFAWACLVSSFCAFAPAHAMGIAEAAQALGNLRDGNRANAIANLARTGQLGGPMAASDAAQVLTGTTQGSRASAIAELSLIVKADLTGKELSVILGPATDLTDGNRANAIAALARAKRFGPSIGGDAGPALDGATQGARATAIGEMAPYFRTDMRGQDVASILGSAQVLSEGNRANAIAALARAGRMPRNTTGTEAGMILVGATQGARATAIAEMATAFKSDLSGPDLALTLGPATDLTDGNRANAIAALARAKRFGPSIGGDAGPALDGATQGARATAIGEMAPYFRTDMRGQDVASILGSAQVLSEGNRANAIAALARSCKLRLIASDYEIAMLVEGLSAQAKLASLAELKGNMNSCGTALAHGSGATSSDQSSSQRQDDLGLVAAQITAEIAKRATNAGIDEIKQKLVAAFIVELAKELPPEVAKRLTLNPRGVIGWAAKITNKELGRDIVKLDPGGFALGVASEAIVEFIRSEMAHSTTLQNFGIEFLALGIRESTVAYAWGHFGIHAAIAAQSIVSGTTLLEASQSVYEVASSKLSQPQRDAQAMAAAEFLRLRAKFKAETNPTQQLVHLQQINAYLSGEGRAVLSGYPDQVAQRQRYVCTLAKLSNLTIDCSKL